MIDTHSCDSSDSDNPPFSQRTPLRGGAAEKDKDQICPGKMPPIVCAAKNEPSPSPSLSPPSLCYSIPTSSNNSVSSTPSSSPRRGPSLFPNPRHLPFPVHSLFRPRAILEEHAREVELGTIKLDLSPLQSVTLSPDLSSQPRPYLEPTHLSLPVPLRYWRFESVD